MSKLDAIRAGAAAGHTARAIGEQLGLSKNAVIGVCYRNGIKLAPKAACGLLYSPEEDGAILALVSCGRSDRYIAEQLRRPLGSVQHRLHLLRHGKRRFA